MKINRRDFIKSSTCAMAALPAMPYAMAKTLRQGGSNTLKGFIVSDAHFGWRHEMQPAPQKQRELIAHIHERFPDLDVWLDTGDAHHSSLGGKDKFDAATTDWCDIIANQSNNALFYYVPGNHEIVGPTAEQDSERRCARMGSLSYRPYYSFDLKGIHFVSVPELEHPTYVNKETLEWLKLDLELNLDKTVILLSHNNIKGTTDFDETFMEGYRGITNSKAVLNVIKMYPNVISWMHGHNHDYVISKQDGQLFVSNGRIGGFNPTHAFEDGEPLGGIYFEVTPDELIVRCYSAEHRQFLDEDMGRLGRSQTLKVKTTLDTRAPTNYAFGHGGFVDGQKAAVYNYHTSKDPNYSLVLAGTDEASINENIRFFEYTHRNDNPKMKQWDVFGFKVTHKKWPRYFEEKNELWHWLNPGVLLYARQTPEEVISLHLPAPHHGQTMYYRAVADKPYLCSLTLSSEKGGQMVELMVSAHSQEGKPLWKTDLPKKAVPQGENTLTFPIEVPALSGQGTIYNDSMFDTEIQLAVAARVTSLLSELEIKEAVFMRADAGGSTQNPTLVFGDSVVRKEGVLGNGQKLLKSLPKPQAARWVVEGTCQGSHRLLWYCRQTNIDWQVRNAPVADRGSFLAIEKATNTWSTGREIVVQPTPDNPDGVYVHRMKNITAANIWPLNRGNKQVCVEMLSGDKRGIVEVRAPHPPADVKGAKSWSYENGMIRILLVAGTRATIMEE